MNQPDGWVVIGTKVDDTGFKKGMKKLENEKVQTDVEVDPELQGYEWLAQMAEKKAKKISEDAKITPKVELQEVYNELSEAYLQSAQIMRQLQEISMNPSDDFEPLIGITNQLDAVGGKIDELEAKAKRLTGEVSQDVAKIKEDTSSLNITAKKIDSNLSKIGKGMSNIVRKVGHWAIAVLGVYSAYSFVRQAMSTLAQYDKTLAADLEYIRFAIATSLKPVVEFIVDLIYKLLGYTRYLLNAWFGIDIFANASASAFKRAKENLKSSANSAKEIKKQLAGFDEMNILVDTTQKDTNKDSDFTMPSHDLGKNLGDDVPGWLRWLGENKDWLLVLLAGIVSALLAMKLGFGAIKALGIGAMISGIVYAILGLLQYLKNPIWENFGKVIQGIGIAFLGLALVIGSPVLAIVGAIILIWGTIVKYWDKIRDFLQGGIDWLTGKSTWIHKHLGDLAGDIYDTFVSELQRLLDFFDYTMRKIKKNFDLIIDFVKYTFAGKWTEAWGDVKKIFSNIWNEIKQIFDLVIGPIVDTINMIGSWIFPSRTSQGAVSGSVKGISKRAKGGIFYPSKLPKLALGGIINQPGRGVPYNGAIIGERGAEAVLPLTDSQQMALLGEAIGKYITINANITNTMNGRVISRELQKVQNDNDFAFNR